MPRGIIIGAASSNSGKTTLSIGIMRALSRMGKKVAPYKCGPDYIDTQYHKVAAGRPSMNLDLFMASPDHVQSLFIEHAKTVDYAVVEGVMGLFDGYDRDKGSVAEIAKILNLPVILVIDASSSGFSIAALIAGYRCFDHDIHIAGVIFNCVSSPSHIHLLLEACSRVGVECLGCIPRHSSLSVNSRHLGLTLSPFKQMDEFADAAADIVERHVDLKMLVQLMSAHTPAPSLGRVLASTIRPRLNIAIAYDEAFSFIYEANIMALEHHPRFDVRIARFSPLHDKTIPTADLLYIPGGYPEIYAESLALNRGMLDAIHSFAADGGNVFAECGGMMYLCRCIDNHKLCDVLPLEATMTNARLTLGYRTISTDQGLTFRGHEFHYSSILRPDSLPSIAIIRDAMGQILNTRLYRHRNVLAGYTHFYWANSDILSLFGI